jgi:uncharacterized protein YjhX (UPF0386 family)
MGKLSSFEISALRALEQGSRHHFDLSSAQRDAVDRLWKKRLIRLKEGDVWEITEVGLKAIGSKVPQDAWAQRLEKWQPAAFHS